MDHLSLDFEGLSFQADRNFILKYSWSFLTAWNCQASRVLCGQGFRGIQQTFSGMTIAQIFMSLLGTL